MEIVRGADDLCAFCPHNSAGTCGTESKVVRYDGRVLDLCAFSTENGESGALSGWSEIRKAVEEHILAAGLFDSVCGDCSWHEFCSSLL